MYRSSATWFLIAGLGVVVVDAFGLLVDLGYVSTAELGVAPMIDWAALDQITPYLLTARWLLWLLSGVAFLAAVLPSKKFLAEVGGVRLEDFRNTIMWFVIPYAPFYAPWNAFAIIRSSLTHYVRTQTFERRENGAGATALLTVLFFLAILMDVIVHTAPVGSWETYKKAIEQYAISVALFSMSFGYAVWWLASLSARLKTAVALHESSQVNAV